MYLSRLRLSQNRVATLWASNPYRVHQRLTMALAGDPRLLFRIEDTAEGTQVIVQSHLEPNWDAAFAEFDVLRCPPEYKKLDLRLAPRRLYRFRLVANPTVKRQGARHGLLREEEQRGWLVRKLNGVGARLVGCTVGSKGLVHCKRNPAKDANLQTHLAVHFEGVLAAQDLAKLELALETGIGSAKGYGFGLLSLAPA
jgi:CRISPR system Cascade subunit CasE